MKKIYEFSLDRRTLRRILGGVAILNILVFAAGFFTGVSVTFPQLAQQLNVKPAEVQSGFYMPPADPTPEAVASAAATKPVADEDLPAEEVAGEPVIDPDAPALPAEEPAVVAPRVAETPIRLQLPDSSRFAVQVGAFLSPANAEVLIRDLKDRGYTAYVFMAPDGKGRTWHLVRIGGFIDRNTATSAATDFRSKERMTALVRPANAM